MRKIRSEGFTLIELMIVIAIIAIIAAIAIPGLLQSQRASNERNASASLKTLASAEADLRGNDRDANKIQDYWVDDVAGLYTLCPIAAADPIKLIELSIAGADFFFQGTTATATAASNMTPTSFTRSSPKAGYWYRRMESDETGIAYETNTGGDAFSNVTSGFNFSKFGFLAFPDSHSSGRAVFIINEGNVIYKRATIGTCKPTGAIPNSTALIQASIAGVAGTLIADWPNDTELKADYSKLD